MVIDVVTSFNVVDRHSLGERLVTCLNIDCQASRNEFICFVVSRHCVVQRALLVVRIVEILCGKILRVLESVLKVIITLMSRVIQVFGSCDGVIGNEVTA